jgi:ubiquinone/menaquinone biosynthesis C-methylase UbiE
MISLDSFPWPPPSGSSINPKWTGHGFDLDGQRARMLTYEADTSHWSDDLTSLHEVEAGRNHPIDLASRSLAVSSMNRLRVNTPVILDVGCSSGFILEDLKQALPHAGLISADYLRDPLESLAKRMPDIPILQFDLRKCPLPTACVDGITCLNVLEHIDDHETALAEIHRILKPEGIAHIEVPAGPLLYDIYDEHLMHHRRYRLMELVAMAQRKGFKVLKATHLGVFVYPVFALTKRRNKKLLSLPHEKKAILVVQQIRRTRKSLLFALLMSVETVLGNFISYPCGIRCIIVLGKV